MIIFINGYPGFGAPPAGSAYWSLNGYKYLPKVLYGYFLDGDLRFPEVTYQYFERSSSSFERGYLWAKNEFDQSSRRPIVRLVSHSKGFGFAEGIAEYLSKYEIKYDLLLHLNPFISPEYKEVSAYHRSFFELIDDPVVNFGKLSQLATGLEKFKSVNHIKLKARTSNILKKHRSVITQPELYQNELMRLMGG